ncbi:RagB/SusD family nutrient uptake outer membrane protein [Flexithrix dorotheae]|uniref:RagB/SusD family nutrient uptake outer membrane protein n=1 Tax=Flexithrix dorotheae TaxID=70993 RepID=UPI00146DB1A0|nr:RagB/SusD family nutrient uptake outer membrane protein [Flexithrix dorotheae]
MQYRYIKVNYLLTILLILATTLSCQDLEEEAKGSLISDSFFTSQSDLDAGVIATYAELVGGAWGGIASRDIWGPLMGADDLTTTGNNSGWSQFDRFAVEPLSNVALIFWRQHYRIIYAANNVIENYEKVQGDQEQIMISVAQTKFLRAFSYFWLVRMFGDVPITSSTLDLEITRSPTIDVYNLIEEDLLFAEKYLPGSWPGEPGRVTVWAAKSLLSQVYLTMAGWPLKDETKYTLAAQKAEEVIDNSGHILLPDYKDVWLMANEVNEEIVWAIQFCRLVDCGTNARTSVTATSMGPSEEGGWDQLFFEINFFKNFPEGPRKDFTFHTTFTDGTQWENSNVKHPFVGKYRDGSIPGEDNFESRFLTGRNLQFLRFSDILLVYAEATAMSTGPDNKAYEAVNMVKRRAKGLPIDQPDNSVDLENGLSNIAFRDAVLQERAWELAAEYSRWFDLVRTEKVKEANENKDSGDLPPLREITQDYYLMPIPVQEIQINPNLTQNNGYGEN